MLSDKDRIFTNVYGFQDWGLKAAQKRGDWDNTKDLIAKGQDRRAIARGLHASVIRRAAGMISRVSSEGDIVFTGGVAQNPCMRKLLAEKLRRKIIVSDDPQMTGALGAALLAAQDGLR